MYVYIYTHLHTHTQDTSPTQTLFSLVLQAFCESSPQPRLGSAGCGAESCLAAGGGAGGCGEEEEVLVSGLAAWLEVESVLEVKLAFTRYC